MDPYLQSLIEARKDAMSCLKSSLDNVSHILQIVSSLNSQLSAEYSSFVESNNDFGNNAPSSSASATGVIGANQLACNGAIGNELRRVATLMQMSAPADGASARTTEFQGRPLRERVQRCEVAAAETLVQERAEESRDKARREPDTSPAKDAFTAADHIKVELDDVVDVDKPMATDSTNISGYHQGSSIASSDATDDFIETFSLDERLQLLADKQRNEDSSVETSSQRSTRLQPMVRLEVLDDEDLQSNSRRSKGKAGRSRKRRGSNELLTDEEYEAKLREKKRQYYMRNRRRNRKPAAARIIRDEPWPSRIQPKRPAKSVSIPVTVVIKDEVEDIGDGDKDGKDGGEK